LNEVLGTAGSQTMRCPLINKLPTIRSRLSGAAPCERKPSGLRETGLLNLLAGASQMCGAACLREDFDFRLRSSGRGRRAGGLHCLDALSLISSECCRRHEEPKRLAPGALNDAAGGAVQESSRWFRSKRIWLFCVSRCLTFELSGRQRHGALDSKRRMGRRPSA